MARMLLCLRELPLSSSIVTRLRVPSIDQCLRSTRYALRVLVRAPVLAVTVVVTLAFGIGATTAVFSAMSAVLLKPLDFPGGDRLVRIRQIADGEVNEMAMAAPRLADWSRMSSAFDVITGFYVEDVSDTTSELAERVRRAVVAPRFLRVWGVAPALGRDFSEAEHRMGSSVVVVSDRYWRERLGADSEAIGRLIRLEDRAYAVVGVMPASFRFPVEDVELWWPYPVDAPDALDTPANRALQWYIGVGRLKPRVTIEEAKADLALVQAQLAAEYPETDAAIGVRIEPLKDAIVVDVRESIWLLFGAVAVLLLIACVNITTLLLSRTAQRQHELSIRFSLGASRAAVAMQLLVETALLAFTGAALGLLLAAVFSGALQALAPRLPRIGELAIDGRVLAFTAATAVAITLVCGALPALTSARGASAGLQWKRTSTLSRGSIRSTLVGVQIALSVVLLTSAGLLVRSLSELSSIDPGFETSRVLAFRVSGNWNENYAEPERLVQRINTTLDELASLPGVAAAATSWTLPGAPGPFETEFDVSGGPADTTPVVAVSRAVSPEYFDTVQIPIVAGELCRRVPSGIHRPGSPLDVMVNQSFVSRYLPARSAMGRQIAWESGTLQGRIAGVVADARELGIGTRPAPTVYACDTAPSPFPWYVVRTRGDAAAMIGTIRQRLNELYPLRAVFSIAPLGELIGEAYSQTRLRTLTLAFFAVAALLLASIGIYGTLSYAVGLRRREVGLRMAVGAVSSRIVSHFLLKALRIAVVASLAGVALSLVAARALSSMLYGISPSDPVTLAAVVVIVLLVATVAALAPSIRAARIDPMRALRED